jgi:single-stranded-DNA-specific exonuclease
LADQLETMNERRRAESRRILAEAEAVIQTRTDWTNRRVLLLTGSGWTSGVLGIAAGQLAERHGRPVLVLSDDGVVSRGSARSVPGFDIAAALADCRHLLTQHGGHSQAAGLTVPSAQIGDLESALEAALLSADLDLPRAPTLKIDADLPAASLTLATARRLQAFEPFGVGNEQPLFRLRRLAVRRYDTIGKTGEHLKLHLASGRGTVGAVMWGAANRSRELLFQSEIDAVATLGIDLWDGHPRLQVELKDFRPAQ